MERVGSGIRFMIDQMRQLGRPDPQFYEQGEFVVIFSRSSIAESDVPSSVSARLSSSVSTSPRQKRSRPGTRHFYPAGQDDVMKRKKQKLAARYASARSKTGLPHGYQNNRQVDTE